MMKHHAKRVCMAVVLLIVSCRVSAAWDQSGECRDWLDRAIPQSPINWQQPLRLDLTENVWTAPPDIHLQEEFLRKAYRTKDSLREQFPDEDDYVRQSLVYLYAKQQTSTNLVRTHYAITISQEGCHVQVFAGDPAETSGMPIIREVMQRKAENKQYETMYVDHRKKTIETFLQKGLQFERFISLGQFQVADWGLWTVLEKVFKPSEDAPSASMRDYLCLKSELFVVDLKAIVSLNPDDTFGAANCMRLSMVDTNGLGVRYFISKQNPRIVHGRISQRYGQRFEGKVKIKEVERCSKHVLLVDDKPAFPRHVIIEKSKLETGEMMERREITVEHAELIEHWNPSEEIDEVLNRLAEYQRIAK